MSVESALAHALLSLELIGPSAVAVQPRPGSWSLLGADRSRAETRPLFTLTEAGAADDLAALDGHLMRVGWTVHPAAAADPARDHGWRAAGDTWTAPIVALSTSGGATS